MSKKLLFAIGTRPEAIKVAPVIRKFKASNYEIKVCNTGQHTDLLDPILDFFELDIDYSLEIMKKNQSLFDITTNILSKIEDILDKETPDLVFVHGDTSTAFIVSLACFYKKIKVSHIEAGLRTFDKFSPYPEEMNRTLISSLADIHLAPTERSMNNLLGANVSKDNISVTGNTVIDSLHIAQKIVNTNKKYSMDELITHEKIILFTGHRRENFGKGFENIFMALKEIVDLHPEVKIIYPVHPNPNVKNLADKFFKDSSNISIIDPLDYGKFVWLMSKSYLIITDSGGIQEEAPSLGKPVLVTRDKTERPEAVEAGTVILVGNNMKKITKTASMLISNQNEYQKMSKLINPYGDGKASDRIVKLINKLI